MDQEEKKKITEELRTANPTREVVPLDVKIKRAEEEEYFFVVALPERPAWNKFRDAALDEERRGSAVEDMVKSSILYPKLADFMQLIKKRPGLVSTVGNQITKLVGASSEVEVGNF